MRNVNLSDFQNELMKSDKPVLLDFYADWCGPCRMVTPIMEKLADEYGEDVIVAKVNVDNERVLAGQFDVMSIPTVALMKDGKIVSKVIGARPIGFYKEMVDKAI